MHSIFCGRHTGRPYDVNDGYAPNAFPSGEGGQAKLGRMRSNFLSISELIAFGDALLHCKSANLIQLVKVCSPPENIMI